jgi:hypothetical protein
MIPWLFAVVCVGWCTNCCTSGLAQKVSLEPTATRLAGRACRWAEEGKRQVTEGVIDQLKDQFDLERHRAKTLVAC